MDDFRQAFSPSGKRIRSAREKRWVHELACRPQERAMMVKSQRLMALTADTAGWLKRHRLE
jgi:hypothetical protein